MSTISQDELVIRILVDDSNVEQRLKKVEQILKDNIKNADSAGSSFAALGDKATRLNQALELASKGFSLLSGAASLTVGKIGELIERGEQVGSLVDGFERLGGSAEAIERASAASIGLVTNTDLIAIANKAMVAGLPDINNNFESIAKAGAQLADTLGQDTKSTIEQLTQALASGREIQLKMLGVTFDSAEAQRVYAESIGKTADALTEQEVKFANQNAAIERVKQLTTELADVTDSAANAKDRFGNAITNLTDRVAVELNQNEALQDAYNQLTNTINNFDVTAVINGLNSIITVTAQAIGVTFQLIEAYAKLTQVSNARLGQSLLEFSGAAKSAFGVADEDTRKLIKGLSGVADMASITAEQFEFVKKKISEYKDVVNSSTGSEEVKFKINSELSSILAEVGKKVIDTTRAEVDFKKSVDAVNTSLAGQSGLSRSLATTTDETNKLAEAKKKVISVSKEELALEQSISKQLESEQERISKEGAASKEQMAYLASGLESAVASAIGSGIRLALNGGNSEDFKSAFTSLGADAGRSLGVALGGQIGGELGSVLGEKLSQEIFDGARAVLKGNRGDIQKELSGTLGLWLKANPVTAPFAFAFESLLGGKDAAANARQALTNTLNDAIKAARNDYGINLADFYIPKGRDGFNPYVNEAGQITTAVRERFNELNTDLQGTFSSLAPAFKEIFNLDELGLSQVTELFGINFGGLTNNLNDLQLLLQSMNVDAEQTGKLLEDAYLKGDLAAGQFLTGMSAVNDLFTQGIPGSIGATGQALDNLITGGLESGRQAYDSLGDIASEALEKGITNFQALRADLIAGGRDIKTVDQLFQALANNGITSIEGLQDVTVQQTAGIISSLENSGFGFDQVTDSISKLRTELDEIKSKEIDIKLNVTSNYDNNTQQLLNNTSTSQALPRVGNA